MSGGNGSGRQEIEQAQLASLNRLLRETAGGNRFYQKKLMDAGLTGGVASLAEFQQRMPLTTKAEVAADHRDHPPYGTNLTYPLHRYTRFHQTSGTTGTPIRWLDTPESWQALLEVWKRVLLAAGVTPESRLYFAFSFGPFIGFWTAYDAAVQMGCLCIPGGGLSSLGRLEAMRANQADVLLCTPTYAMRLSEVAASSGIDLADLNVRKIIVAGEPGGSVPEVRADLERRWPGARLYDHHGMTELGPVSFPCPEKDNTLIIDESAFLPEIVDPNGGDPVERSQPGELVLTTLHRVGSPLLRYRTGDLVREDLEISPRHTRHEMALEGGILGRVDDMVVIRGVNVYPSAIDAILRSVAGVAEYRVRLQQKQGMAEMELEVEPEAAVAEKAELVEKISAQLRTALNLRVPVRACDSGTLPRFEMKARRWVREDSAAE